MQLKTQFTDFAQPAKQEICEHDDPVSGLGVRPLLTPCDPITRLNQAEPLWWSLSSQVSLLVVIVLRLLARIAFGSAMPQKTCSGMALAIFGLLDFDGSLLRCLVSKNLIPEVSWERCA